VSNRDVLQNDQQIPLGTSLVSQYQREGYVVVPGVLHASRLASLRADISRLIAYKLRQVFGKSCAIPENMDAGLLKLESADPAYGVEIISATWRLQSFLALTTLPAFRAYAFAFLGSENLLLSASSMRYDRPHGDEFLIPWHQDYPFIQDSENSCVIWFPLNDLGPECGGVRLLPRSHTQGLRCVRQKAGWLELTETPEHRPPESVVPNLKSGDVLFMNTMTLHRSEENRGDAIRWTGQFRMGDFSNAQAIRRGWPRGMTQGQSFEEHHAEYIVE
jgi:hypothetical protein